MTDWEKLWALGLTAKEAAEVAGKSVQAAQSWARRNGKKWAVTGWESKTTKEQVSR